MPRSGGDAAPKSYMASGSWPTGTLAPDAPTSAHYAQALTRNLQQALEQRNNPSQRSIARDAEISRTTIERTLSGDILPDLGSVARLEAWLDTDLWPGPELRQSRHERAQGQRTLDHGETA